MHFPGLCVGNRFIFLYYILKFQVSLQDNVFLYINVAQIFHFIIKLELSERSKSGRLAGCLQVDSYLWTKSSHRKWGHFFWQ